MAAVLDFDLSWSRGVSCDSACDLSPKPRSRKCSKELIADKTRRVSINFANAKPQPQFHLSQQSGGARGRPSGIEVVGTDVTFSDTLIGWNEPGPTPKAPDEATAAPPPSIHSDVVASVASLLRARRKLEKAAKAPLARCNSLPCLIDSPRISPKSRQKAALGSPVLHRKRSDIGFGATVRSGARAGLPDAAAASAAVPPTTLWRRSSNFCIDASQFEAAARGPSAASEAGQARPLLIFDWDDTLLPLTFLTENVFPTMTQRYSKLPEDSRFADSLRRHGELIKRVLRAAKAVAEVAIITLGQEPWVTNSSSWYLGASDMEAFLEGLEIPIFYARGYAGAREKRLAATEEFYNLYSVVKQKAMKACLKRFFGKQWRRANVTSIGDSYVEEEALHEVMWNTSAVVKTVKFLSDPYLGLLDMELEVLLGWLPVLASHNKDACIRMASSPQSVGDVQITFVPHHID